MGTLTGKRVMIAGTGSGCGKTTAVCGILYGLKKKFGLSVASWKCGPDYIDPMFHKRTLGIAGGNLDLFFSGAGQVCELLAGQAANADISVIEGAMGYYDGIGMTQEAGCHALAQVTETPVILVVNPKGMGASLCALLHGFLHYRKPNAIRGIIFNEITAKRYESLKPLVEAMGLKAVGYLPRQREFVLESRHLGLVTADEIRDYQQKIRIFYTLIDNTIDWELFMEIASGAPEVSYRESSRPAGQRTVRIGIARDEAFCFLYEDNLRYLRERGCELVFFSPLRDSHLPDQTDGLILCGGYPELYAHTLSENAEMRQSVKAAVQAGMPCIAECGGFLYLQNSLTDPQGATYKMAGALAGGSAKGRSLRHFGYIAMSLRSGNLFGRSRMQLRAHEFHYYECVPDDMTYQAFAVQKASGEAEWMTGWAGDTLYAGFPHIYFYGNEDFAEAFLEKAQAFRRIQYQNQCS